VTLSADQLHIFASAVLVDTYPISSSFRAVLTVRWVKFRDLFLNELLDILIFNILQDMFLLLI